MATIDEYLAKLQPWQKQELEQIRRLVKEMVPSAEEVISYGMPAFKYQQRILIYFAAHTHHIGVYPVSDEMVAAVGEELAKFRTSKGTLQFAEKKPIPIRLLKRVIKFRVNFIDKKRN